MSLLTYDIIVKLCHMSAMTYHSRLIYCMCGNEIESKSEFNTTDSYNGAATLYIQTEKTSLVHAVIFVRLLKGRS